MNEKYRDLVLDRIAKGHSITLRKAVPAKKSTNGKPIKAEKKQVPGVTSKVLLGKTFQNLTHSSQCELEMELGKLRELGIIHCTNGVWWVR